MEASPKVSKKSRAPEAQSSLFDWPQAPGMTAKPVVREPERDPFEADASQALDAIVAAHAPEPEPPVKVEIGPKIYSVTELAEELRDHLADRYPQVIVQGEIADFKGVHRNGHLYCGLKDDKSQMRMVMWRGALTKVPFDIKGGLEVICTGRLDYYGGSGSLQFVAEKMEPVGIGALQLKFEQLKEKLRAQGLFDPARKRPVPRVAWRIGVVTSLTGAALQDMLRIFRIRFPLAEVSVFHAAVQGERAPAEIVAAIASANRYSAQAPRPLDVLIVGRGGGSYEDLFCFNDESVARALAASKVPTVSAVGHEIDVSLRSPLARRTPPSPPRVHPLCEPTSRRPSLARGPALEPRRRGRPGAPPRARQGTPRSVPKAPGTAHVGPA